MALSIREAAREAKVSKSTILRAIQRGRLSADRDDDGNYQIDPSEVFRVYPPRTDAGTGPSGQGTPPTDAAVMQARIEGLDAQLAMMRERLDEMRGERDIWREQAQSAQRQAEGAQRLLADRRPGRGWFRWLRAG